jgi:hypothetical protein
MITRVLIFMATLFIMGDTLSALAERAEESNRALANNSASPAQLNVKLYVHAFSGPGAVGKKVSSSLGLEIIDEVNSISPQNTIHVLEGLQWDERAMDDTSAGDVRRKGLESAAHLILWGDIYNLEDGAIAQINLMPSKRWLDDPSRPDQWTLTFPKGYQITSKIELPQLSFEPFRIWDGIIEDYDEISSVPIYDEALKNQVGILTPDFQILELQDDRAQVLSNGTKGWLDLVLIREDTESRHFITGIILFLKSNWAEAIKYFKYVMRSSDDVVAMLDGNPPKSAVPEVVLIYSLLFSGLAEEKLGNSGIQSFQDALDLNPLRAESVKMIIMGYASDAIRNWNDATEREMELKISKMMDKYRHLFRQDDEWFKRVQGLIPQSITSEN